MLNFSYFSIYSGNIQEKYLLDLQMCMKEKDKGQIINSLLCRKISSKHLNGQILTKYLKLISV